MNTKNIGNGYQVQEDGTVLGKTGKPLKPHKNNNGYLVVDLYDSGVRSKHLVHRLIAKAFCEGYQEGLQVNHIDADRTNNHSANLEWVTQEENLADSRRRNGDTSHIARAQLSKVSKKRIIQYSLDGELIKEYPSPTDLCTELGWAMHRRAKISEVAHGKRPHAFGFRFEWADPSQASRSCSK